MIDIKRNQKKRESESRQHINKTIPSGIMLQVIPDPTQRFPSRSQKVFPYPKYSHDSRSCRAIVPHSS